MGQNAVQSICLIRNIPFILWNYRTHPDLQEIWTCIGSLLRIIEIVYSRELTEQDLITLRVELKTFSTKVIEIAGKLIPKIHIMLHYPYIMEVMGPIRYMNMFRYERKHKELKNHLTKNFKNINKSIAQKHQELLCLNGISYKDDIKIGISKPIDGHPFEDILKTSFENCLNETSELKSLKINNYEYRKNLFIIHKSKIFQIESVFSNEDCFFLLTVPFVIVSFDFFSNSFEIKKNESVGLEIINISSLDNRKTYESQYINSKLYIIAETLDMKINKNIH